MRTGMNTLINWSAATGAFLILVLNIYNAVSVSSIRSMKAEHLAHQKTYAKQAKIRQVNNQLIQVLANVSAKTGDEELKALLASEGVTFSVSEGRDVVKVLD